MLTAALVMTLNWCRNNSRATAKRCVTGKQSFTDDSIHDAHVSTTPRGPKPRLHLFNPFILAVAPDDASPSPVGALSTHSFTPDRDDQPLLRSVCTAS
ncbi:hypothetical protein KUCAC02_037791 [Chaenocephalus aceratus]|nr:hypothetical protein KUCAC02_037791 [Chaenocephalus aceratus]